MQPIPSLNVNINATHAHPCSADPTYCDADCRSVLIPCPVPRSVTFEVVLGWLCDCRDRENSTHLPRCPCEVVRVSCSISGKTWEESHLSAWETEDGIGLNTTVEADLANERWGFIKSLVLGHSLSDCPEAIQNMRAQRDAVFCALVDMARAESVILQRFADIDKVHTNRSRRSLHGFAADELSAYVERLIEQVSVLP